MRWSLRVNPWWLSLGMPPFFWMELGRDKRVQMASTDGSFSLASRSGMRRDDMVALTLACLWKIKAPPRVLAFSWLALLGGILTMNNLWCRKRIVVNVFLMFLGVAKSIDHLLLNRKCAQLLWRSILRYLNRVGRFHLFCCSFVRFGFVWKWNFKEKVLCGRFCC